MPDDTTAPYLGPNPEAGTVAARTDKYAPKRHSAKDDAALLITAKKRFQTVAGREARMRSEMLQDVRFRASEQWPLSIKAEREMDGRPCITINRLPVFIRQVTNQQRQSKPSITINPVDSGSDPKTAEVLQGLIRHIEVNSQADVAYDTACDHQVTIGRGFFRVVTEWNDVNPWEQDIKIKRIRNPFTVYFDPSASEADYHDARYAFIIEDIPKDEFLLRYSESDADSAEMFASIGDSAPDWMPEGKVRVAEYYYVEERKEEIALLSNGSEQPASVLKDRAFLQMMEEAGVTVVRQRTITRRQVKWCKITGAKILERRDWPGRWIPILPVIGDEIDINGEIDLRGMVRDARDPQRMYNYWVSAETETIALAPKTPFVGADGQFEGFEPKWKQANRRNFPYLEYKLVHDQSGQALPPPSRNAIEPPIAAIVAATKQSDNDLKAVTGIYDASLGERGPQEAAKAIVARQKQSDIANINWIDNLARAMRALGRVLLDLMPHVYDVPRVMRILGVDDKPQLVLVHAGNESAIDDELRQGVTGIYDLSVGRYDVTVTVGPSYQSRRQEAVEAMTAFMQAFPPAAPAIGDVLAENMDWPGAAVIAKRLKKMVPPQLMDEEGGMDDAQKVQVATQKLQQQGQALEMMTQQLNEAKEVLRTKQMEHQSAERVKQMDVQSKQMQSQAEIQSKERIVAMQMHNQLLIAKISATKTAEGQRGEQEHEILLAQMEHEQAQQQAAADLENQQASQQADREHEAALAQQKMQADAQTKMQQTRLQQVGQAQLQQQKLQADAAAQQQQQQVDAAAQQQETQADQESQGADQGHEAAMAAADAAHQAAMDEQTRRHELALATLQGAMEETAAGRQRQHESSSAERQRRHETEMSAEDRKHEAAMAKAKPKPKPKA